MLYNQQTRTGVFVKPSENITQALRKFKKTVAENGKLQELREKQFYTKPTTERKKAKAAAKARLKKKLQKESFKTKGN